jgi:hypothetical protein
VLAILENTGSIYEHVADPARQLVRALERRVILNAQRIEHYDVGVISGL